MYSISIVNVTQTLTDMDINIIDLTNADEEELPAADLVAVVGNLQIEEEPEVEMEEDPEVDVELPWEGIGPRRYTIAEKSRILNYLYRRHLVPHYQKPAVYQMMIRECPELADRTVEGLRALVRRVLPEIDRMHICEQAKQQFHRVFAHSRATSAKKARQQAARRAEARKR